YCTCTPAGNRNSRASSPPRGRTDYRHSQRGSCRVPRLLPWSPPQKCTVLAPMPDRCTLASSALKSIPPRVLLVFGHVPEGGTRNSVLFLGVGTKFSFSRVIFLCYEALAAGKAHSL